MSENAGIEPRTVATTALAVIRSYHAAGFHFFMNVCFKDIVQPKKRGVKRGIIRFVLTSYTIADIFLDTRKGLISRRKFATKNLKARCDVA